MLTPCQNGKYLTKCAVCDSEFLSIPWGLKGSTLYCSNECARNGRRRRASTIGKYKLHDLVPARRISRVLGITIFDLKKMVFNNELPKFAASRNFNGHRVEYFLKSEIEERLGISVF